MSILEITSQFLFKVFMILQCYYTYLLCQFLVHFFIFSSTLVERIPSKSQIWHFQVFRWKFLMLFSKPQVSFSSNFGWLFSVTKDNTSGLFQVKRYIFCTKATNQSAKFWDVWVIVSKFTKFLLFLKQQIGVSSNFALLLSVMRHNSSVLF